MAIFFAWHISFIIHLSVQEEETGCCLKQTFKCNLSNWTELNNGPCLCFKEQGGKKINLICKSRRYCWFFNTSSTLLISKVFWVCISTENFLFLYSPNMQISGCKYLDTTIVKQMYGLYSVCQTK